MIFRVKLGANGPMVVKSGPFWSSVMDQSSRPCEAWEKRESGVPNALMEGFACQIFAGVLFGGKKV
jgi:hypothetical protein